MSEIKKEILILGGGPAGMACAMELHNAGRKSTIIEKEDSVGGLAKTLEFREGNYVFRTDLGPHRFFSKNQYLYDFIEDLLKEKWLLVQRKTRQFIDGKFYDYPINAKQAFMNLGVLGTISMVISYLYALILYRIFQRSITSFEDYIVAHFGRKLGEFNMLNYTEKIWGISCKSIHPNWARQRIQGLNLSSALKKAFLKRTEKTPKTLVDSFYYPQYGTGLIYTTIAEKIKQTGSTIITRSFPRKIIHSNQIITEVELSVNDRAVTVSPDIVVSSIPITTLLQILSPRPPKEVMVAANKLAWRAQVYLFITIDKPSVTKDNWIYFPGKEIPIGRISEMKNFSRDMSPRDKTSIFVEFFVTENDAIWKMEPDKLFRLALQTLERFGFFKESDVRHYYVLRQRNVYPIYDMEYEENLTVIKKYLDHFKNLFYIGRPGRFQYTNQDHSIEMGIMAARGICEEKKYDLDAIGTENEYFEKEHIAKK